LYATAAASAAGPSGKKHRNGVHKKRRFSDAASKNNGNIASRKRPLFLIRTPTSGGVFSPGSIGSGRTSGSEPEDTSQYECDSEGTSATTNSELSFERRGDQLRKRVTVEKSVLSASILHQEEVNLVALQCNSLKEVFRTALSLVLDHFYNRRGGYKLSPAERRRNATLTVQQNTTDAAAAKEEEEPKGNGARSLVPETAKQPSISAEEIFQLRRRRLLMLVGQPAETKPPPPSQPSQSPFVDGPPFTIQRIAEVLVSPERYYTQTHKLCNCLEKLLLITSSTSAFGGIRGGDTSQSRREERELAALADERGRLHSEFRQRRLRKRTSDGIVMEFADGTMRAAGAGQDGKKDASPEKKRHEHVYGGSSADQQRAENLTTSRERLEAAARASLRNKFDHVGIDPHSSAVANRDVRSIVENRGMTNSPPPPSLGMAALPGHGVLLRQHHGDRDHPSVARVPSPLLFNSGGSGDDDDEGSSPPMASMHANPNMHLLQMHHVAAFAGVSPFELTGLAAASENNGGPGGGGGAPVGLKDVDLESRSSASSDVDSESDDVSFDDSASDRSDGSDSGHYEPFSAARAMALNRMQQQQRLQSRMLTSLGSLSHQQSESFRPPADSEYQSGDSVDSMRAEDSGGSDSSYSSDVAD
jgi:hypothetical protein